MIPEVEFDQWRRPSPKPYRGYEVRGGAIYLRGCHIDAALRAFKKMVNMEGILHDRQRHAEFVKPSQRRRLKSARARKR